MRWHFADPAIPHEAAYKQQKLAAIANWWRAFQANATNVSAVFTRETTFDLVRWMNDTLGAVDPRICWEYGPAKRGPGHRLVITPEGNRSLRPLVKTLLDQAPQMPGWEFYPYRLPEDAEQTIANVKSRVGVNITGALVDARLAPGRKIDLLYSFPSLRGADEETKSQAAMVATEVLMGEQVLDAWIGGIGLVEEAEGPTRPLPLERAQATVGALIRSIHEQLPQQRAQDISEGNNWSNCQLNAEPADDYARRDDLLFASTAAIEMFQAAHSRFLFTSACHSRFGEWFCYLKLDASDVPTEYRVDFRGNIEDDLNPALMQAGAGCSIGGGSGLRYSYIDLAITDFGRAIPVIRQVLAAHQAPLRSWLLFFDDDLCAEWVGIYPQTPEPPGTEADEE
jgi:hypothetical protein